MNSLAAALWKISNGMTEVGNEGCPYCPICTARMGIYKNQYFCSGGSRDTKVPHDPFYIHQLGE